MKRQQQKRQRSQSQSKRTNSNNTVGAVRLSKRDRRLQEISALQQRIDQETPARGCSVPSSTQEGSVVISFRSLPISEATLRGLEEENTLPHKHSSSSTSSYTTMTAIQAASLPHALAGRDILGAARTGSGKTLAFLIPVLECLYRHGIVSGQDGPSAIILSPTRELAVQICQVLQQVGRFHAGLQMGLLIGGSSGSGSSGSKSNKRDAFFREQAHIATTNIIIATPGRLLQHLQETSQLDISQPGQVKILVLDEADRILDMGFRQQLISILEYLPDPNNNLLDNDERDDRDLRRQTLLFSATQTRHVKDLATLSLHRPEYIRVHDSKRSSKRKGGGAEEDDDIEEDETAEDDNDEDNDDNNNVMTPERLQQSYIVVPLKDKLNAIYSFIKSHLHQKSIIFLASCSQVRHAHLLFCALRPGVPILCLHGKLLQSKRTEIYQQFQRTGNRGSGSGHGGSGSGGVVLFSTDVCARGLDFPNVDWVVQMDAPEDRDMYIHRAGRTARYKSHGKALLMITPQEEKNGFVSKILNNSNSKKKQLPLKKLAINPTRTMLVTQRAAALVASNLKLHQLAKKAFSSYLRSVQLMPHKSVFRVEDYQVRYPKRDAVHDNNNNNNNTRNNSRTPPTMTTDLDEFAISLGLAATPPCTFLKTSTSSRDESRSAKNVNRKLQKLKEQIKAEKLAKKLAKQGKTAAVDSNDEVKDKDKNDADDDELLVSKSKQRHNNMDESSSDNNNDEDDDNLPDPGLDQVTRSRKKKRIRIEARGSAENTRIVFDDDANEQQEQTLQDLVSDNQNADDKNNNEDSLQQATDDYMLKIRSRLQINQEQDREQERDRIRQKHRKRRLQDRGGERDDDDRAAVATLLSSEEYAASAAAAAAAAAAAGGGGGGGAEDKNEEDSSTSSSSASDDESSSSSSSSSSSLSSSDDTDDDKDEAHVKAQEELALALIRGSK